MYINENLVPCDHEFKTGGLLFSIYAGALSSTGTILEDFDQNLEPWSGYLCHPKTELKMSDCEGVFSIDKTFAFYARCTKCNEKKQYLTHNTCFYCLRALGPEIEQDNLKDYFKEHRESAGKVSLKTCLHCHKVFAWYRVDTDKEMGF